MPFITQTAFCRHSPFFVYHTYIYTTYSVEYDAEMKAWNNDWRPDRWVKQIHKHRMPYLRAYAPPRAETYEGKVR